MTLRPGDSRIFRALIVAIVFACSGGTADASLAPPQIHTVAGGGSCSGAVTSGGPCDGVAATSVPIAGARSVSALPGGGYLYIDAANDLVREVSPSGVVTTVAGTSQTLRNGSQEPDLTDVDGVPAIDSGLDDPVSVAALPSGGFLVTEFAGSRVRLVSPGPPGTATITTIAGIPPGPFGIVQPGDNGNSGPGTSIELNYPTDAQPTANGGVLIADTYNNRIMLLSSTDGTGTVQEIAGGGSCVDSNADCDGQPAGNVALALPDSVSEIPNGSGAYIFAEYGASAVREVSQENLAGSFTTVAGEPGSPGYSGDGDPATDAQLTEPEQVLAQADGSFVIADSGNDAVREVSAEEIISTIAGDGIASFEGDGGDATAASLNDPASVSRLANGNLLVADDDNNRIREITIPPTSTIALTPTSPAGNDGWYLYGPIVTITSNQKGTTQCELDPSQAPPAYGAIQPGCPYTGSGSQVIGDGSHTVWAASQNSFGDQENPVSLTFKVDATPPTITCTDSIADIPYLSNEPVTATLSDSVSGPASMPLSAAVDTSVMGLGLTTLTAANNAGKSNSQVCDYDIVARTLSPLPTASSEVTVTRTPTPRVLVRSLVIGDVPAWASVLVVCKGKGCPFTKRPVHTVPQDGGGNSGTRVAKLSALFSHAQLAPGTQISVAVTAPWTVGRYLRFQLGSGTKAALSVSCLPVGAFAPDGHSCRTNVAG